MIISRKKLKEMIETTITLLVETLYEEYLLDEGAVQIEKGWLWSTTEYFLLHYFCWPNLPWRVCKKEKLMQVIISIMEERCGAFYQCGYFTPRLVRYRMLTRRNLDKNP